MTTPNPTRVAIACQGGGSHTAFTAGVLKALLAKKEQLKDSQSPFAIVALSGTSGGAVSAALAWGELISENGEDLLRAFWLTGYPDGNASLPYPEAIVKQLMDLVMEGRLPWLPAADRLRVDLAQFLLREPEVMKMLPVSILLELRTHYFHRLFGAVDDMTPGLVKSYLAMIREMSDKIHAMIPAVPGAKQMSTLSKDIFAVLPLYEDSIIRREFDILSAFRPALEKYLSPTLLKNIQEKILRAKAKGEVFPELLLGAVDVQKTHADELEIDKSLEAELKRVAEIEDCLEEHDAHRSDHTNFKAFRGSKNIYRLIDCIAASAAIPTAMRGVDIDHLPHWDGLYSHNPPVHDLPDVHRQKGKDGSEHNPQEIWVIRINPMERAEEPDTFPEIQDRRNELAGNLSLLQEIRSIRNMNGMVKGKRKYAPVAFGFIDMDEDVASDLDYVSKLDKRKEFAERLFNHGREQAESFMARWQICH